jgi:hypothetical protein
MCSALQCENKKAIIASPLLLELKPENTVLQHVCAAKQVKHWSRRRNPWTQLIVIRNEPGSSLALLLHIVGA